MSGVFVRDERQRESATLFALDVVCFHVFGFVTQRVLGSLRISRLGGESAR